jgi:hypothetical protein
VKGSGVPRSLPRMTGWSARPADRFSIFLFSCTPKMLPSGEGGIEAIGARWTPAGPAARSWTEQLASGHFFTGK